MAKQRFTTYMEEDTKEGRKGEEGGGEATRKVEIIEKEREEGGEEGDKKHTRCEIGKAMNSIFGFLTFTTEVQSDFPDEYIPTLDLSMRMTKEGRIIYK